MKTQIIQPPYSVHGRPRADVFWSDDPEEAKRFFDMGVDTVLTNRWLALANALSIR